MAGKVAMPQDLIPVQMAGGKKGKGKGKGTGKGKGVAVPTPPVKKKGK